MGCGGFLLDINLKTGKSDCFFQLGGGYAKLMEGILHQLMWQKSHYAQGFIHLTWRRISSINSMFTYIFFIFMVTVGEYHCYSSIT